MGFCKKERDEKMINHIISLLSDYEKKHINSYIYDGDLESALHLIQESKYILATRFHAMILGWVYGLGVYPIVYSNKSLNVMNDVGYKGEYTLISNIGDVSSEKVLNYLENSFSIDIIAQQDSSKRQFIYLDNFLN